MIRISTYSMFQNGEQSIGAAESQLMQTELQLSSGKQINTPSDNPVGAANVASLNSTVSQLTQFQSNQTEGKLQLDQADSAMSSLINLVQDAQQRLVQAGDGTYSDTQRAALAQGLQGDLNQMVGLANTSDGQGGYLFGGSHQSAPPFTQVGNNVTYGGDSVLQSVQVSQNRQLQIKFSGDDIFQKMRPGNGSFVTAANSGNTGSGVIDTGSVANPSALTGDNYSITFAVSGSSTTYQVQDTTRNTAVSSGSYTSPATISFDGLHVTLTGTPANNDSFTVAPAPYQSLFTTMSNAIAALQQPAGTPASSAQLQTSLASALGSMGQALDHLTLKQAEVGTQLQQLNSYSTLNNDRTLQASSALSSIQDLDYAKAASQMAQQQTVYQAALQSYSAVSKLSLFNYL
ncbi:MAG TPA: flagellar hook-associated protein FlgL [Burkholderiaceae bacterium]|jgi:flagellar hook-associated protein 3 FlgL|nr:flagellar hook-associated protein FlgL [Burkholderiaceae bacterium]